MTHYGGLVLAQQFVRRFRIAQRLDQALKLFKRHAPYHESDHVLALTYTLYADGACLEDQAALQGSEAVRRLVGACRIPDPTTAGDFLRRFKTPRDGGAALGSDRRGPRAGVVETAAPGAAAAAQARVGAGRSRRARQSRFTASRRKGRTSATTGAGPTSRWSSRSAGSGECLRVVNQPGNARSSDAAAAALRAVLPRVKRHFRNAMVRGDTDFDRADVLQAVVDCGGVLRHRWARVRQPCDPCAGAAREAWQPFIPRGQRGRIAARRRARGGRQTGGAQGRRTRLSQPAHDRSVACRDVPTSPRAGSSRSDDRAAESASRSKTARGRCSSTSAIGWCSPTCRAPTRRARSSI